MHICNLCIIRSKYTRRELFAPRDTFHRLIIAYIAEIPVSKRSRLSRLTNVYALCLCLMSLIILIHCSSLMKTSLWINRVTIRRCLFNSNGSLGPSLRQMKSIEIQSVIHFIHWGTKEMQYSLLPPLSAAKWNSWSFIDQKSCILCISRKVCRIMSTSRGICMPISHHFRWESELWNSHFFIHLARRISFWAELSEFDRLLYHVDSLWRKMYYA